MPNRLEQLKASHPEWCFRCGGMDSTVHNQSCMRVNPVIAAIVAALEEVEKDRNTIQKLAMDRGDALAQIGVGRYMAQFADTVIVAERDSLRAQLHASEAEAAMLREALEDIRDNYDHDEDAHRHGTRCRACTADSALSSTATAAQEWEQRVRRETADGIFAWLLEGFERCPVSSEGHRTIKGAASQEDIYRAAKIIP